MLNTVYVTLKTTVICFGSNFTYLPKVNVWFPAIEFARPPASEVWDHNKPSTSPVALALVTVTSTLSCRVNALPVLSTHFHVPLAGHTCRPLAAV